MLQEKADTIGFRADNPSPSGDAWFDSPENMRDVIAGVKEADEGKGRSYSLREVKELLGI